VVGILDNVRQFEHLPALPVQRDLTAAGPPHSCSGYGLHSRAAGKFFQFWCRFQEFKSLVDDNESKMLRAFCLLEVDAKGSLDMSKLKGTFW
jgi:hypothetical protein